MLMKKNKYICLYGFLFFLASNDLLAFMEHNKPKLILQITVDQLRGDLPTRYYDRLGKNGFRYLWENGVVFSNAHHAHANTETIVGHATLATGTHPAIHGMIGNTWFDRETNRVTYNIEDPDYHLLSQNADVDKNTEIDPTQRIARSDGRSPAAILVSTFADELSSHTNGQARVFAVSVKDRGAVAMAGHSGKAFWFSKSKGEFVTSNYYYDQYPKWVLDWNAKKLPLQYADTSWELLNDKSSYLFADSDDRKWETDLAGFGRVFPHPYGKSSSKYFNTLLTLSPAGDELTLAFAETLLLSEKLGQDDVTDYLSVSFSSTDYVGHLFGPSSLEEEDNILRLDRQLEQLIKLVDQHIGLENTLIVLSADHGGPDTPGYANSLNIPAGYIDPNSWEKQAAIDQIKKQFNIQSQLIEKYDHPYIYLSPEVITDKQIDLQKLEQAIVQELLSFPGVYTAVSSQSLEKGALPDTPLNRSILNNHYPQRSGNLFIVFKPNWFINDFDGLEVASTHGSPWRYDTYVPIVFAGMDIKPDQVTRKVLTVDIAPTLAQFIQSKPPSGSVGKVLEEVLIQ